LSGGFVILCSVLLIRMRKLANYCRSACDFVVNQNKNAVSLRRLTELETTLTELLDSYDALLTSHKKLRSRIGMRQLRDKPKANGVDSDAPPADEAGRAAYKSRLRNELKQKGML